MISPYDFASTYITSITPSQPPQPPSPSPPPLLLLSLLLLLLLQGKQSGEKKKLSWLEFFRSIRSIPYDFASTYITSITPPQPLLRVSAGVVAVICRGSWIIKGRGENKRQATQKRKISLDFFRSIWSILFYNFTSTYTAPITPPPPQPLSRASTAIAAVIVVAVVVAAFPWLIVI